MVDNAYTKIKEMKEYAKEFGVPIMHEEGIDFLTTFVIKHQITNVLEIGTAIGFSAITMALANPKLKITTIERDEERYLEAVKNIKKFKFEERITLLFNDAANVKLDEDFDLIFIDAAKAQNIKFFEMFSKNLNPKGTIITDNMNFHGLVDKELEEIKSRNLRALVRKLKDYAVFLQENKKYETDFLDIGDGIAISRLR